MKNHNDLINITVILGTSRKNNRSNNVARLVEKIGQKQENVKVRVVDPSEYDMPYDGNNEETVNTKYLEIVQNTDAFFIVTPEYNHGYPGSLKRLLDGIPIRNYVHKPVVVAGVSTGNWGGTRAIENLVPVLRELGMIVSFVDVQFPNIKDVFNNEGELQDQVFEKRIQRSYDELIWLAKAMKYAIKKWPNAYHEK